MKSITVLIDTNIILDWLLGREPYTEDAVHVLDECCIGNIKGYIAAHSITNVFYIVRKQVPLDDLRDIVLNLLQIISVVPININNISRGIQMKEYTDIEDAIQTQCAIDINADYILTRNKKDFTYSNIPVVDYEEFLNIISL